MSEIMDDFFPTAHNVDFDETVLKAEMEEESAQPVDLPSQKKSKKKTQEAVIKHHVREPRPMTPKVEVPRRGGKAIGGSGV